MSINLVGLNGEWHVKYADYQVILEENARLKASIVRRTDEYAETVRIRVGLLTKTRELMERIAELEEEVEDMKYEALELAERGDL